MYVYIIVQRYNKWKRIKGTRREEEEKEEQQVLAKQLSPFPAGQSDQATASGLKEKSHCEHTDCSLSLLLFPFFLFSLIIVTLNVNLPFSPIL